MPFSFSLRSVQILFSFSVLSFGFVLLSITNSQQHSRVYSNVHFSTNKTLKLGMNGKRRSAWVTQSRSQCSIAQHSIAPSVQTRQYVQQLRGREREPGRKRNWCEITKGTHTNAHISFRFVVDGNVFYLSMCLPVGMKASSSKALFFSHSLSLTPFKII